MNDVKPRLMERIKRLFSADTRSGSLPTGEDGDIILITDTERPIRIGLLLLVLGFGGFALWAALAPLDEGVPASATVVIDTKRKTVQHPSGGIIKEVLVREGQMVKKDDVLIRLEEATTRANFESTRQRYIGLRAQESRLLAETADRGALVFHPDLLAEKADPLVQQHMANQEQLFQLRRLTLQTELSGLEQSISGLESTVVSLEGQLAARKASLAAVQEQQRGIRDLVEEGHAPRQRLLELDRTVAEITGQIAETQGNIIRTRQSAAEMKNRQRLRRQEMQRDAENQLAALRLELDGLAERYKAAGEELSRIQIRSPADGQVLGIVSQTPGGVIQPGIRLMDIIPQDAALILEARIPPNLIDKVKTGLKADIRFSTFANTPQLVVPGVIESVAGDLITEPGMPMGYYLARISVTPEGLHLLGHRHLQPGMPAEMVIKTGERTLLKYLLHPLVKRMASSMKEE